MFRLDKKLGPDGTCLAIDGEVSTECIEVIETCCDAPLADGKPVDLFLPDVITVDESGRTLLSLLAAKGVRLLANGVYASYLVETANLDAVESAKVRQRRIASRLLRHPQR